MLNGYKAPWLGWFCRWITSTAFRESFGQVRGILPFLKNIRFLIICL